MYSFPASPAGGSVILRWQTVLAIAIVPFLTLSLLAPFVCSGAGVPKWHPHYRQDSIAGVLGARPAGDAHELISTISTYRTTGVTASGSVTATNHHLDAPLGRVEDAAERDAYGSSTTEMTSDGASDFSPDERRKHLAALDDSMKHMYTLCDGRENLPTWVLKQCDPKALAMVRDFIAHEHLLGTDRERELEDMMTKLQTTYWRDGKPIALWSVCMGK